MRARWPGRNGVRQVLLLLLAVAAGSSRCGWEVAEDSVTEIVVEVFSDPVSSSSHILGYGPAEVSGALQVVQCSPSLSLSTFSLSLFPFLSVSLFVGVSISHGSLCLYLSPPPLILSPCLSLSLSFWVPWSLSLLSLSLSLALRSLFLCSLFASLARFNWLTNVHSCTYVARAACVCACVCVCFCV